MTSLEQAREIFNNDRYATSLTGVEIASVGDHEAVCALTVRPEHCNARGVAMGGVMYTMADFAAAVACNTDYIDSGDLHWVSLDATVHYLAPVTEGTRLAARSATLKHGRTTALYQTIIESPDSGKRIAIVETTMVKV
jgi:acyl-CoA thioesterase